MITPPPFGPDRGESDLFMDSKGWMGLIQSPLFKSSLL